MASKRRQRRRSCETKIRYSDETAANRACHSLGFPYMVYACGNHWHVGRPNASQRQSLRARAVNKRKTE